MSRYDVTYMGRDTFLAECAACQWEAVGKAGEVHDAAVKHVRTAHQ